MNATEILSELSRQRFWSEQIAHVRHLPPRDASWSDVDGGLHPAVAEALGRAGIERLYGHQARAVSLVRAGLNVLVVTGTASGKTLCYNVPVAERIAQDSMATMLYLYPTKALAQDQLRAIGRFDCPDLGLRFLAGTYDGDTPAELRRKLRDKASVLLTNPDMLHQGILPNHARWNRFFSHLAFVVVDEVHAYRGVFGSHLANVIRRLDRICGHYGSKPVFIGSSATIGNPREHAERVFGRSVEVVSEDGSPRGARAFVLWNPPPIEGAARGASDDPRVGGDRRSSLGEAVHLMKALVTSGVQTIAFVRTRLAAEMILRDTRRSLAKESRRLAASVEAYRSGYLPDERREIERKLAAREVLGVASTNALELGIDIGSLDACIMVGYPGTVASLWQQAGRAGRGRDESLVFLIGQNAPVDQYLMAHPDYLFAQNPEQAVVDPDNPHIVVGHLQCAVHELPLDGEAEGGRFGPFASTILDILEEGRQVEKSGGRYYWADAGYPAQDVSLRNIAGPVYTIQDDTEGTRVVGTTDELSAMTQLHDNAVYLHSGETYLVRRLDLEQKVVHVERRDLDYYTQSIQMAQIRIDETSEKREDEGCALGYGEVTVTTTIPMFKKVRFHSRDSLGFESLDLPPQTLETVAFWMAPSSEVVERLRADGHIVGEALLGFANVLVDVAPFFVMCDTSDIGATVDASCLGADALFVWDRYPGGMGFAKRCLERVDEITRTIATVIRQCSCDDGCPSCVGSAVPVFAMTDLDSATRGRILSKQAARALVDLWSAG